MSTTPISLLERLAQPHDAAAWAQFVRLYTPLLFSWAQRTGLQEADAADLLQDVFAVLVVQMPAFRYQPGRSFRGWLRTVLLNRWRALQRKRRPALLGAEQLDDLAEPADPEPPGEAEERRQLLAGCLGLLQGEFSPVSWQAFHQTAVYIARSRILRRLRRELAGLLD